MPLVLLAVGLAALCAGLFLYRSESLGMMAGIVFGLGVGLIGVGAGILIRRM